AQTILKEKELSFKASFAVDKKEQKLEILKLKLNIDKSAFSINGKVNKKSNRYLTDINFKGEDANIQTFLSFMPNSIDSVLKEYHSSGLMSFDGHVNGYASTKEKPQVEIKFNIANGSVKDNKHSLG